MNRIKYYYDFSRAGRIKYAARQLTWLRYIADPKHQMLRLSFVDPLDMEYFDAECRTMAEIIGINLTRQESRFIFRS